MPNQNELNIDGSIGFREVMDQFPIYIQLKFFCNFYVNFTVKLQ